MERTSLKYLLDTAPWINLVTLPEVVPRRIHRLLESQRCVGLCSVSLLESAILYRLGRFKLQADLRAFFDVSLAENTRILEISPNIAVRTNELSESFQGDPFDRTIVATAKEFDLTLITSDQAIKDSGVCQVDYYPFKPSRRIRSDL